MPVNTVSTIRHEFGVELYVYLTMVDENFRNLFDNRHFFFFLQILLLCLYQIIYTTIKKFGPGKIFLNVFLK